ncbi:DUF6629 family protein [Methylosinus sp. Sm6]|uniref:DUF6629 family protein n=1 Tax=Methylosinus sp. Sm6 TaxID=2866948 RepID=UPI001C999B48|nr:DUF6629 family protein [Methylosinus sp. Sm6]MBY6240819.1 hypothetical protein [Methylosinus sp. Sm6]
MCYSLEASLTAAIGLGLAGYGMVTKALRRDRRMLAFAAFPFVFSVHQLTEGAVWLTIGDWQAGQPFRFLYTLIAFALWPVLTPYAASCAETDPERRRLWLAMTGVGAVVATYLTARLVACDGVDLSVVRHSLAYDPLFDRPPLLVHFLYVTLTVVPLVASRRRGVALFGWAVLATFVLALIENRPAWYSVWCMAAALFSLVLASAIGERRRSERDELQAQR